MKLLAGMGASLGTIMIIGIPMLISTIATLFLMSGSVAAFPYPRSPIIAYPQTEPILSVAAIVANNNYYNSNRNQK